jgi:cobyric acid synthase
VTERTIYRWRIDRGLAFHQELAAIDRSTDEDWNEWVNWSARLELEDRHGQVVVVFDSDSGEVGEITFESDGTVNFDVSAEDTAEMTPTSTVDRGKEKAQLVGTLYATDPLYPDEPYALALVKCVVKEP